MTTVPDLHSIQQANETTKSLDEKAQETIFISYRISTDQTTAIALKKLIETSIAPEPFVFVCGDGGLRPSSIGFKPQIQRAAQQARAFVGIITETSKEREWIFYEAGAAWGRGQLYAPVLVGTAPEDLPNSISEYQATFANDQRQMELLIEELAKCTGGEPRQQFGRRFQTFIKAINNPTSAGQVDDNDEELSPLEEGLAKASDLINQGKRDVAEEIYAQLAADASTEDKHKVSIHRLVKCSKTPNTTWSVVPSARA